MMGFLEYSQDMKNWITSENKSREKKKGKKGLFLLLIERREECVMPSMKKGRMILSFPVRILMSVKSTDYQRLDGLVIMTGLNEEN